MKTVAGIQKCTSVRILFSFESAILPPACLFELMSPRSKTHSFTAIRVKREAAPPDPYCALGGLRASVSTV